MFIDKDDVGSADFIVLMYLLNTSRKPHSGFKIADVRADVNKVLPADVFDGCIDNLLDKYLIVVFQPNERGRFVIERKDDDYVGLTLTGMSFMVNYAQEYLKRIEDDYGELPERLTATLIPYLELRSVPAADRYVSTTDNRPAFQTLAESLEAIRLEILKDQNSSQLPIKQKRAVIAELDGMLAQIRGGFVKLSDLTSRIRPMVKNLAETCKDFTVIAGAASAAYLAIAQILGKLF